MLCIGIAIIFFVTLLQGCAPPYRKTFWDEGDKRGWTEKQKLAAFAYADRIFWARESGENKYVILYRRVPTTKVREQLEQVLQDYNDLLDPKNLDNRRYLDALNLTDDLKHDKVVNEATYARVRAYELYNDFNQDMGTTSSYGPEAEFAGGYNAKKIYAVGDLSAAFPFTSDQIEAAKKDGTLKVIETAEFDLSREYDHKDMDPLHPDDANEFVWKSSKRAVKLTNYKIVNSDKPDTNKGDYIEGYRILDGKQESKPCLKIFFPANGSGVVVLIDTDREGEPGFGVPDLLSKTYGMESVQDIIKQGTVIDALFQEKPKTNDAVPPITVFKIEIAKVGAPLPVWEQATTPEGFIVPFKYVSTMGDNYNVRIKFKVPEMTSDADAEAHAHSQYMEIEYIEKEYTAAGDRYTASQGAVTEYYRPRKEYAGLVQAQVMSDTNTKKLDFTFPDGNEISGIVVPGKNKFIEDKPYAKAYNEGGKRFWIESSGGDKFEKRKQVAQPKEKVGDYSQSQGMGSSGDSTDTPNPNNVDDLK